MRLFSADVDDDDDDKATDEVSFSTDEQLLFDVVVRCD